MVIDATRLAIYMVFVGDLDGIYIQYIYIYKCDDNQQSEVWNWTWGGKHDDKGSVKNTVAAFQKNT